MSRFKVWPWVRPFLVLVLAISIPWVVYWLGFVQSSVLAARQQAYQTLAAVASDFSDRLIAHDRIAATAADSFPRVMNLESYLRSVLNAKDIVTASPAKHRLQLADGSDGLHVYVSHVSCEDRKACSIRATVPLEHLIPWNVVETEFDGLLILSEGRRLLAQDRRLPAQPLGGPVALTLGAESRANLFFKGETDREQRGSAGGIDRGLFDFRSDALVQVAGVEYVAFLQQVSVPRTPLAAPSTPSGAAEPLSVVVCGLIARDRLRREAISLSPQTLILVGTLVALGVFAIPFLKLRFIGERERMHHRDVWLLAISIVSATALLVLVILNAHAIDTLRARFDAGLTQMAQLLRAHIDRETTASIEQLNSIAPALLREGSPPTQCSREPPRDWSGQGGSILSTIAMTAYPDIEALVVTDRCGNQLRKWMARTIPTPYINHSPEAFFTPALTLDPKLPDGSFAFSTTLAPTSGLLLSVFAVPVNDVADRFGAQVSPADRTGVFLIAHEMRSVNSPVIAEPYQFVLVDRRGTVTYHHSRSSFRGERFFEAVRGGAALERTARANAGAATRVETYAYRGQLRRMTAIDVPQLNLTFVAYYDRAEVGGLSARIFATAALFSAAIVVAVLVGAALSIGLSGKNALDWMWPSMSRIRYYVIGTAVCLLVMWLLLIARSTMPPQWLPWLFAAVAFVTVLGLGSGVLARWTRMLFEKLRVPASSQRTSLRAISICFTSFATIATLTFVAWPTKLVFDDAFDLHTAAYGNSIREQWRTASKDRNERATRALVNLGEHPPAVNCRRTPDLRCSEPDRIYASHANHSALLERRREFGDYDSCVNLTLDPPACGKDVSCNETAAAYSCERREDVPYSFTARTAFWLAHLAGAQSDLVPTLATIAFSQANAVKPGWGHGLSFSAWGIGSSILLFIAAWALIRSVATHVLGIGLMDDTALDESSDVKRANGTKWLLLRPSQRTVDALGAQKVDLRDPRQQRKFVPPPSDSTLLLEHVEFRLNDPQWRSALLELMTARHEGCLIATTEVDPLHYLSQRVREKADYLKWLAPEEKHKRAQAEQACRALRDELASWAVTLRQVRKVRERAPDFSMPTCASKCLHYDCIVRECAPCQALHDIGSRLLARTDLDRYSEDDVVSFVRDAAEPYYRSVWELCSREERLVLIQLAQAGLVNPKRMDVVRRLARRGLLRVDPRFRLMNRSFEDFVRSVEPPERVTEWERTGATLAWTRLATPLYALAAMAITVLLFAEQGLLTNILAVATGSAATIGSLRSLYATVTKTAAAETKVA